ncbi:MAG: Spy/CpxP family protein refolding chaperone [Bacteroidetes bacterium]|jgi:Spy/CpxP family protein refolding chaperone|nr:Spy/CpxP family protein refolding chaperone [Bacteroidota bacterium]
MRRSIILLAVGLLIAAGSGLAQPRGPMSGRGAGEGKGPRPGLAMTDEQESKMSDLRVKFLKESEPVRADLEKQQSALRLEMTADKFNESRVRSIQAEIAKMQGELGVKRAVHQRAVRDLLTPDQQKQFDTRILAGGRGPNALGRGPMHDGRGRGRGTDRPLHRGARR